MWLLLALAAWLRAPHSVRMSTTPNTTFPEGFKLDAGAFLLARELHKRGAHRRPVQETISALSASFGRSTSFAGYARRKLPGCRYKPPASGAQSGGWWALDPTVDWDEVLVRCAPEPPEPPPASFDDMPL